MFYSSIVKLSDLIFGWLHYPRNDSVWWWFCRYMALLAVSLVCYLASFVFSGFLFHWFTPSGADCQLNTFFIVFTLILGVSYAIISLHPQVGSWMALLQYLWWGTSFMAPTITSIVDGCLATPFAISSLGDLWISFVAGSWASSYLGPVLFLSQLVLMNLK